MAKKKTSQKQEINKNNTSKEKKTSKANLYYQESISSLEKKYQLAMRMKNYEEAKKAYTKLEDARKEYRNLLHKKELVKI